MNKKNSPVKNQGTKNLTKSSSPISHSSKEKVDKTKKDNKKFDKKSDKKFDKSVDKSGKHVKTENNATYPLPQIDAFPKNVNDYLHIIKGSPACRADVEYMLVLRNHKKIGHLSNDLSDNSPPFYKDDLEKYTKRFRLNPLERTLLQTNIGNFRQMFGDKANLAINDTTYKYQVTLRNENLGKKSGNDRYTNYSENKPKNLKASIKGEENKNQTITTSKRAWDNTLIPKTRSLFKYLLPPVLRQSKEIFGRLDNKICRPILNKHEKVEVNGQKINKRFYEYDTNLALRFPSEHNPSSVYKNDYGMQNINQFKHLMNFDNRTMTSNWTTYLRPQKKVFYDMQDTKKREQNLRNRSAERSFNNK